MSAQDPTTPTGRMQPTRRQPPIYAGYVRVSSQGSREDDRFRSPTFQADLVERFGAAEGLALRMFPAEIDVSGSDPRRAVLDDIVTRIESGELAGVIVSKLDRLSRLKPLDRLELFERIENAGGAVFSASENIDVSTPEGRFARDVFLGIARMQWEKYRDDFEHVRRSSVLEGVAPQPRAPFGYRFDERHRFAIVDEEAEVVRSLFELRSGKASFGDCVDYFDSATGRTGSRTLIRDILSNRAYRGELHWGTLPPNLSAHVPIIDEELFEQVQRVNEERSRASGFRGGGKRKTLLAGLARCAACESKMTRLMRANGRWSYRCENRRCTERTAIPGPALDEFVIEKVIEWAGPSADRIVEVELSQDRSHKRELAERRLEEAELRLIEWAENVDEEEANPDTYTAGLEARRERRDLRRRQLEALGQADEFEVARSTIRRALAGQPDEQLDTDLQRRLLAVPLEAVYVGRSAYRGASVESRVTLRFRDEPARLNP